MASLTPAQRQPHHCTSEFRTVLDTIEADVPADLDVHLVMDDDAPHTASEIREWLARWPKPQVHRTPTGASWLDQVERLFALLTGREIRRGVYRRVEEPEEAIDAVLKAHNADPSPVRLPNSADRIIAAVKRFCLGTARLADT